MSKIKTTANTYKPVVLQRAILICWGLLFVCFAIKIFGGNYFEIVVNSPKFVEICTYLDSNIFIYGAIGLASSLVSYFLYYLAILKQLTFNKKQLYVYLLTVFVSCVVRVEYDSQGATSIIINIINVAQYFVVPFLLGLDFNWRGFLRVCFAFSLNLCFQLIALFTKNIGIKFTTESSLVTIIFMIDLYIMLVLYYLYSNYTKKGGQQ